MLIFMKHGFQEKNSEFPMTWSINENLKKTHLFIIYTHLLSTKIIIIAIDSVQWIELTK